MPRSQVVQSPRPLKPEVPFAPQWGMYSFRNTLQIWRAAVPNNDTYVLSSQNQQLYSWRGLMMKAASQGLAVGDSWS